ncbi:MAG: 1-deoxy-D-xylulose-5-phosphate synthase [Ilumatobacter coccineus]|uniref:1-deoxy-D-xylulose-5-phosphate synthase n=1 Tax=Ilumatobacter coccineus TaxID=467094 RepID=A0A2G6KFP6_9ACTN|nr:MAG: 1-deoxy-D-xylulose-5-phosphate synthase [Ilumatobacter coccineus]
MYLERIDSPADLRDLTYRQLDLLAGEIRELIIDAVSTNAGHLGSNLGAVELSLALHRVFDSPTDAIIWDTGHQAYVHKIVTGRRREFAELLRQSGGLSGYPSREESPHDLVENSHASTALSYAYGLAAGREAGTSNHRHIVAVVGDGAMTGGLAYEALNNLGHSKRPVIIVLNDNGRSYAPTVSNLSASTQGVDADTYHQNLSDKLAERLAEALTDIRLNPVYVRRQRRLEEFLASLPAIGHHAEKAVEGLKAGVREFLQPPAFFEALGVRYVGPVNGHSVAELEDALHKAEELAADGPIVVHVLTQKGRGYSPAETDDEKRLHDAPTFDPRTGPPPAVPTGYTQAFADAVVRVAERDPRVVAITAAMPGPTGLLEFEERFPDRCFDVGIAEQHAVTAAAGMAMAGLRPIVAIYSTFLSRAWDQVVYDVALHGLPVVFCLDRAGITGPDGASHHGMYDLALMTKVPGMRVLAPSSAQELARMVDDATSLTDDGPVMIRYSRGSARHVGDDEVGAGLSARRVRSGDDVCVMAVGRMLEYAEQAAALLDDDGIATTVWDVRSCAPLDPEMVADAARFSAVITVEDGIRDGGIGMAIADHITKIDPTTRIEVLGIPTRFIPHGDPAQIFADLGLDARSIAERARHLMR